MGHLIDWLFYFVGPLINTRVPYLAFHRLSERAVQPAGRQPWDLRCFTKHFPPRIFLVGARGASSAQLYLSGAHEAGDKGHQDDRNPGPCFSCGSCSARRKQHKAAEPAGPLLGPPLPALRTLREVTQKKPTGGISNLSSAREPVHT